MATEMEKTKIKMYRLIYLSMSTLDISKTLMHKFWHDFIKPKYQDRVKLCYMDTDSFAIKTEHFYKDIANDVKKCFETSNYSNDDNRPLPIGWNEKIISLFKDELGGRIMKELIGLRAKTYAYLMNDDNEHKKGKATKNKCNKKRNYV